MSFEHPHDPLTWICADVRELPLEDQSIDLAFDKGTLDTIICASQGDPVDVAKREIKQYMDEVSGSSPATTQLTREKVVRVLHDDASFHWVTFRHEHFVQTLFDQDHRWTISVEPLAGLVGSYVVMTKNSPQALRIYNSLQWETCDPKVTPPD